MARSDAEREAELAQRYRAGDRAAGGELVRLLERWLHGVVRGYRRMGLDMEDVMQEGRAAILRAAEAYDASRGAFEPYAGRVVYREVFRAICDTGTLVILPARVYKAALQHLRAGEERPEELDAWMRVRFASTDATAALNGPDQDALGDVLAHHSPSAEEQLIEREEQAWIAASVWNALTKVPLEARSALMLRRLEDDPLTIAQAAAEMGITEDALCYLDATARSKLRRVLNAAFAADERAWWIGSRKRAKPGAMAAE